MQKYIHKNQAIKVYSESDYHSIASILKKWRQLGMTRDEYALKFD